RTPSPAWYRSGRRRARGLVSDHWSLVTDSWSLISGHWSLSCRESWPLACLAAEDHGRERERRRAPLRSPAGWRLRACLRRPFFSPRLRRRHGVGERRRHPGSRLSGGDPWTAAAGRDRLPAADIRT